MKSNFSCRDLAFLLTDYLEGILPQADIQKLERHLGACPDCRTLLGDIQGLSGLVLKAEDPADTLAPIAERALAAALKNLRAPQPFKTAAQMAAALIPEAARLALSQGGDLPLRLMAQTHDAFLRGELPTQAPFLPASVLAQLPAQANWKWSHRGSIRRTLLAKDPDSGQRLFLMHVPPHVQIPAHTHLGSESLLVLEGEMENADACLGNGQWVHMPKGSSHAPYIFSGGCWCLVREEGTIRYEKDLRRSA